MQEDKILILQPGTDTDVQIIPSFTKTDDAAIEEFEPDDRKCYQCNEVGLDIFSLVYIKMKKYHLIID